MYIIRVANHFVLSLGRIIYNGCCGGKKYMRVLLVLRERVPEGMRVPEFIKLSPFRSCRVPCFCYGWQEVKAAE